MLTREGTDRIEIKDVSEGMGDEHCPGAAASRPFKLTHINLISRNGNVYENWHQAILKNRIYRRRKTRGHGNDFIPWL